MASQEQIVVISDGFTAVSAMLDAQSTRADLEGALYTAIALSMRLAEQVRNHPTWKMSSEEYRDKFENLIKVF